MPDPVKSKQTGYMLNTIACVIGLASGIASSAYMVGREHQVIVTHGERVTKLETQFDKASLILQQIQNEQSRQGAMLQVMYDHWPWRDNTAKK